MKTFQTISNFPGYFSKPDMVNTDPPFLVKGSQNVIINDAEKVAVRKGFSLYGAANAATDPIESNYDWHTSTGVVRNLRSYEDELEVVFTPAGGSATWYRVLDAWADVDFSFAEWWDATEVLDLLLFVNGGANIYEWSGGIAQIASTTATTIVKTGTNTWAQDRFYTSRNRSVLINGTTYTYTGGATTTALTGVTPDPTGEANASVVTQTVVTRTNEPAAGRVNDVIITFENHLVVGSHVTNRVEISEDAGDPAGGNGYLDFSNSSPRAPGEGATLTINGNCIGFGILNKDLIIFSGKDRIYKTEFEQIAISTTLNETLKIRELKSGSNRSAMERDLIVSVGDSVAFIDNNKQLRLLTSVEDVENPIFKNISDPLKPDFDAEDFTNGHLRFQDNRFYVTSPVNSKLYIYEIREDAKGSIRAFWQPPQLLPVRRIARIADATYFHSNGNPETYRIFDGKNDNGVPFKAVAKFAYRAFGDRVSLKTFDEYFTEGYISPNTTIKLTLNYDFDGATQKIEKFISGSDTGLTSEALAVGSFGDSPLGDVSLGGGASESSSLNPYFHIIHELERVATFFIQAVYEIDTTDYFFEILAHGPNAIKSPNMASSIKR